MNACLSSIEKKSNSKILDYYTNTPTEVSGNLANGGRYKCYYRLTGTDGLYFLGEWNIPIKEKPTRKNNTVTNKKSGKKNEIYCRLDSNCSANQVCVDNKCTDKSFVSDEGQACSDYTVCSTGLRCVDRVCKK